jgi:hypothetical protein
MIPTKVPTDFPSELSTTSIPSYASSSNSSIIINSAIEFEQSEESSTQSLSIYTVTGAVVLLAVFAVVIFVRKRSLEGSCDDDDLENSITRINVTDNFGVAGNSESLSRDNKRSMINVRDRDGTLPIVKNARMTSLLDNVSFSFFCCTEPKLKPNCQTLKPLWHVSILIDGFLRI